MRENQKWKTKIPRLKEKMQRPNLRRIELNFRSIGLARHHSSVSMLHRAHLTWWAHKVIRSKTKVKLQTVLIQSKHKTIRTTIKSWISLQINQQMWLQHIKIILTILLRTLLVKTPDVPTMPRKKSRPVIERRDFLVILLKISWSQCVTKTIS
jgi:hypothetical protein